MSEAVPDGLDSDDFDVTTPWTGRRPDAVEREFDVILYGASGFVGALTAKHLADHAGPARIALAGRTASRLEDVRSRLGAAAADWPVLVADATDAAGLRALAARTTVLASTVGPYAVHGREVVRACAETGTHYADLTGEVLFVRWTLDEVDEVAAGTGAKIVHACGYDSVPSDLGVMLLAQQVAADGSGMLAETTLAVRSAKGGLSGGTIDSARQQAITAAGDPGARQVLGDPYGLSPRRDEEPGFRRTTTGGSAGGLTGTLGGIVASVRRLVPVSRDSRTGRWNGPFVMAGFNTRIVRLSNTLTDWSYGRELRYREVVDFGRGPMSPVLATGMAVGVTGGLAGLAWGPTRALLDRFLPKPGEGPSAEARAAGRFAMAIDAMTTTGARYEATVAAPYDPGYEGTAVMLGQSVLALAFDDLPSGERGGVLTPSVALGPVLVDRLRAHGFTLEVERVV